MKKFRIHPATIFFLILLIATGYSSVVIPYLTAIILHELAHAFVAKKLGYSLNKVWILPYGACVSFSNHTFSAKDEIKIAFAGPLINVAVIIITVMLWWIFPSFYSFSYTFVISNFSIALFNLIPAFPLDGGRILTSFLKTKINTNKAYKIATFFNLFFSILFFLIFIISCFYTINFSYALFAIFLFLGIIEGNFQGKYSPIIYEYENKKKDILLVKNLYVNSNTPFYKIISEINRHKFNIIFVKFNNNKIKMITENQFYDLLEKNSLESTFENIYYNTINIK